MIKKDLTKAEMTGFARRAAAHLKSRHGLSLKHMEALSLTAAMLGYPNSNTMLAAAQACPKDKTPYKIAWVWPDEDQAFDDGALLTPAEAKDLFAFLHEKEEAGDISDLYMEPESVYEPDDFRTFAERTLKRAFFPHEDNEAQIDSIGKG